jgi:hypothetical protein
MRLTAATPEHNRSTFDPLCFSAKKDPLGGEIGVEKEPLRLGFTMDSRDGGPCGGVKPGFASIPGSSYESGNLCA